MNNNIIVGTPPPHPPPTILITGGLGPSKNWVTWGGEKCFAGKGDKPEKGGGWGRNGGEGCHL